MKESKWDTFDHPLTTLTWHQLIFIFTRTKKWLVLQHFTDDDKLQNVMIDWLHAKVAQFYEGICKLAKFHGKYLNLNGDCVEK